MCIIKGYLIAVEPKGEEYELLLSVVDLKILFLSVAASNAIVDGLSGRLGDGRRLARQRHECAA